MAKEKEKFVVPWRYRCAGAQVTGSHHGHTAHSWVLRVLHEAVRVGQAFDRGYALRRVVVNCRIGIGHLGILARARLDRYSQWSDPVRASRSSYLPLAMGILHTTRTPRLPQPSRRRQPSKREEKEEEAMCKLLLALSEAVSLRSACTQGDDRDSSRET